jgi:transcriptional regulator with XRE-family HTH domain
MANLAFVSGIPIRRVQGILNGEFANVTVTTADRLCAGLQVPLSLVYPDAA